MSDKKRIKIKKNSDIYSFGPEFKPWLFVLADEPNEKAGTPQLALIPTGSDLIDLVKFWADKVLYYSFRYFQTGEIHSAELENYQIALRQLDQTFDSLCSHVSLQGVIEEALSEFKAKQKISDEVWQIFIKSNQEEWRQLFCDF